MEPAKQAVKFKRQVEKAHLTKSAVEDFNAPSGGDRWVYCDRTPRLAVVIRASGAKSWYWVGRFQNRMLRYKLGGYPELTAENARRLAQSVSMQVANGEDPRTERRVERTGDSLEDLFRRYMRHESEPHKKTWQQDEQRFKCYCGPLRSHKVGTITKNNIRELMIQIGKTAPVAANRTLSLLQCIFKFGEIDPNPAVGITKFTETSRERFLSPEELPRFLTALEYESQRDRDYFRILLYTGARSANVAQMRWDRIDLEKQEWSIPGSEFKNGRSQKVYLCRQAIEILERRQADTQGEWVFPGRPGNKCPWIQRPRAAWLRVIARAGIEDLTPHDLRRSLGSWAAAAGESLLVIGKILGHASPMSTQVYARLNLDSVRVAVDKTVSAMLEAGKGGDDGEA